MTIKLNKNTLEFVLHSYLFNHVIHFWVLLIAKNDNKNKKELQ